MKVLRFVAVIGLGAVLAGCTAFGDAQSERDVVDCASAAAAETRREVVYSSCVCAPARVAPATCEAVIADAFGLTAQGPSRTAPMMALQYSATQPAFMVVYNAHCRGNPGDRTSGVDYARCDWVIAEIERLATTP